MGLIQRIFGVFRGRGRPAAYRSFSSGGISRLTASWTTSSASVNADLDGALGVMRARARDLTQNNELARRFLSLVGTHVVGPYGPQLQVRAAMTNGGLDKVANQAVEEHWRRWGEVADAGGLLALPEIERLAVKAVARDGEALVRIVRDRTLPYGLGLQLLEADRLDERLNGARQNGAFVRQGVERDGMNRRIAYHVLTDHPGEEASVRRGPNATERIDARDVLHLFVPERAEQVRGYTWFHATLNSAQMLRGYQEAAVVAARVGASKMGFFKRAEGDLANVADGEDSATGELFQQVEPGVFGELPPGYDFVPFDPDYPHENFDPFTKAIIRQIAGGLDVDYATLSGDLSGANYSSMRAGALETRDHWMTLQEWWIRAFCLPVYREWLATALISGQITLLDSGKALPSERLGKFRDASRFQGRRWAWVDPKNDAETASLLIDKGLASRTQIAASQGRDFDDVLEELAAEKLAMQAAGLAPAAAAPAASPGGTAA